MYRAFGLDGVATGSPAARALRRHEPGVLRVPVFPGLPSGGGTKVSPTSPRTLACFLPGGPERAEDPFAPWQPASQLKRTIMIGKDRS